MLKKNRIKLVGVVVLLVLVLVMMLPVGRVLLSMWVASVPSQVLPTRCGRGRRSKVVNEADYGR